MSDGEFSENRKFLILKFYIFNEPIWFPNIKQVPCKKGIRYVAKSKEATYRTTDCETNNDKNNWLALSNAARKLKSYFVSV